MANYYYLGTLLPPLHIGEAPEIGFVEFEQLLKDNLTAEDLAKTKTIRNFYDLYNLRSYWKGAPLDPAGNLNESDLDEALLTHSNALPPYVFTYIDKYETNEERLKNYPSLFQTFFKEEIQKASGFFKAYLSLERELRLVLVGYRAKKLGRDLNNELQYEDPEDPIVAQILAQKDAPHFVPPEKYHEVKAIIEDNENDPIELEKALCEFRFQKIEEMLGSDLFSIDRVLGYLVELLMVEKWQQLDKEKGLEIVERMLKESP